MLTSLDVKTLLASVEAAPPIDAAEVVAAALTDALGARDVSFLIADYSGQALIRLSHVRRASADDEDINRERGQSVALAGTPHGRALTEQEIQIVPDVRGYRSSPRTSRGEAVGVLALGFDHEPDQQALATVSAGVYALAYIVIANRRFTDLFDRASVRHLFRWRQSSSTDCFPPRTPVREASSRWPDGCKRQATSAATFRLQRRARPLHLSMTDAMGHMLNAAVLAQSWWGALETGAVAASSWRNRPGWPMRRCAGFG